MVMKHMVLTMHKNLLSYSEVLRLQIPVTHLRTQTNQKNWKAPMQLLRTQTAMRCLASHYSFPNTIGATVSASLLHSSEHIVEQYYGSSGAAKWEWVVK